MAFYEYGGSKVCPDDLGYLIGKMDELLKEYEELKDVYQQIVNNIQDVIIQLFESGAIKLDCQYDPETQTIKFVFINDMTESEDKNTWIKNLVK